MLVIGQVVGMHYMSIQYLVCVLSYKVKRSLLVGLI